MWVRFYIRQITAVIGVAVYSPECDFCFWVCATVDFLLEDIDDVLDGVGFHVIFPSMTWSHRTMIVRNCRVLGLRLGCF